MTSQCVQLRFGDWRGVKRELVSALPVGKKEGWRKGKNSISPRMKNGRANCDATTASFCREAK